MLFVVRAARAAAAGELRTVGAFAELVTLMVADRARISELEHAMATIAALAAGP